MFFHEWSAVGLGLSTGIVHNGMLKSPLAKVTAHGAMSTSTVFECDVGGQVYVQVTPPTTISLRNSGSKRWYASFCARAQGS